MAESDMFTTRERAAMCDMGDVQRPGGMSSTLVRVVMRRRAKANCCAQCIEVDIVHQHDRELVLAKRVLRLWVRTMPGRKSSVRDR